MKVENQNSETENEIQLINPNKTPLDIDTLKSFEGLENLSDSELSEALFSIQNLCVIMYEYFVGYKEETKIISIETDNNINQKLAA